jgi:hypothetical protein
MAAQRRHVADLLAAPRPGEFMTKSIRSFAALSLTLSICAIGTVHAQTPAAAPAAPVAVAPNPCETPSDYVPVGGGSGSDIAKITKRIDAYKVCVNDYSQSENAKAADLVKQAQAHQDAGNKAIDDYNTYVQAMNKKTNGPK